MTRWHDVEVTSSSSALVPFAKLERADLVIDAVYEGGIAGTAADDPVGRLLAGGQCRRLPVQGKGRRTVDRGALLERQGSRLA